MHKNGRKDNDMKKELIDAPDGVEQLVIYEVATKSFTSPNGPESGTFASTEEKIPYLQELGINTIWLTGHQLCESHHFYNIWTEYACIRPDRIDPGLGTEAEFKHLVDCAHAHGIRVFLDVITHGVMKESPLVAEHPDWFCGGSWGMVDFDWYGGKKDLDKWWVNTWLRYVTEFGIDGFRLDVAHYRNDLWADIRKKAAEHGKQIIIMAEMGPAIKGVVDLLQHGEVIAHGRGLNRSSRLIYDAAGCCIDRQLRTGERYDVRIDYEDGSVQESNGITWHQPEKVPEVFWEGAVTERGEGEEAAYEVQIGKLRVENVFDEKGIKNVRISDKQGHEWNSNMDGIVEVDYTVDVRRKRNGLLLQFPLRIQDGQCMSAQLSCHDSGWDGFPLDQNPYTVQGSRYLAGYPALLAPVVPVFMSGEEFNADFRPLPGLSPNLFGGEPIGKGKWLYGSWIDWEQLNIPEKAEMLEDVKTLLAIRKEHADLIKACRMGQRTDTFGTLDYEGEDALPVPYFYKKDNTVIVVAANPQTDKDVSVRFALDTVLDENAEWTTKVLFGETQAALGTVGGSDTASQAAHAISQELHAGVADARPKAVGAAPQTMDASALSRMQWTIRRDKTKRGGLLVLKFERA